MAVQTSHPLSWLQPRSREDRNSGGKPGQQICWYFMVPLLFFLELHGTFGLQQSLPKLQPWSRRDSKSWGKKWLSDPIFRFPPKLSFRYFLVSEVKGWSDILWQFSLPNSQQLCDCFQLSTFTRSMLRRVHLKKTKGFDCIKGSQKPVCTPVCQKECSGESLY